MKWTKSIIGKIGFVDTYGKLCYKDAIEKIPKEARIMKSWEYMKLVDEDFKNLKNIPKFSYYFCYSTKKYFRACRLGNFGYVSRFDANYGNVGNSDYWLRGVLVVKK